MTEQMTREQAVEFAETKQYLFMDDQEIAIFQINQDRLCMPFNVFQGAVAKTLNRPVFTHEFAERDKLKAELLEATNESA